MRIFIASLFVRARLRDGGPPPPDQAQQVRAQKKRGFLTRSAKTLSAKTRSFVIRAKAGFFFVPLQLREERRYGEVGRGRTATRVMTRPASLEVRREHAVRRGETPAVLRRLRVFFVRRFLSDERVPESVRGGDAARADAVRRGGGFRARRRDQRVVGERARLSVGIGIGTSSGIRHRRIPRRGAQASQRDAKRGGGDGVWERRRI